MMQPTKPLLFPLPRVGSPAEGFITIATLGSSIPFRPERVFWTNDTPDHVERGGHAHRTTCQVLVSVNGRTHITTECMDGSRTEFLLDDPGKALFLPSMCWRTIRFEQGAVLLVMASTPFDHADYIRDLSYFRSLKDQP